MTDQTYTGQLLLHVCPSCGVHYGVDAEIDRLARQDGRDEALAMARAAKGKGE